MCKSVVSTSRPCLPEQPLTRRVFPTAACPAFKCLLLDRLLQAIDLQNITRTSSDRDPLKAMVWEGYDDGASILYRSAIALRLARSRQLRPLDLAQSYVTHLEYGLREAFGDDFTIEVASPGWIQVSLGDSSLAHWLQFFTQTSVPISSEWVGLVRSDRNQLLATNVFLWQYAHARCCSLLRNGERSGSIALEPNPPPATLLWRAIGPIDWLTGEGQLRLVHPAERQLIDRLLTTVDALCCPDRLPQVRTAVQLVQLLSQSFLTFERDCRIWGEVKTQKPELATARLGLILAVQKMLKLLLSEVLGVFAPSEI
ncbi:MAG: DALR anticodon-binding domain-containing protein [Hormoscilla sp.]